MRLRRRRRVRLGSAQRRGSHRGPWRTSAGMVCAEGSLFAVVEEDVSTVIWILRRQNPATDGNPCQFLSILSAR